MSIAEEPTPSTAIIQERRLLGWLLAIIANIVMGAWLLQRTTPPAPPSLLAFTLFLVAALVLYIQHAKGSGPHSRTTLLTEKNHAAGEPPLLVRITMTLRATDRWRYALLALALLCAVYALLRIPALDRLDDHTAPFVAWALSILLYTFALAPLRRNPLPLLVRRLRQTWRRRRIPLLLLVAIILLALLARVVLLESVPYTLGGDEASQGLEAVRVLQGEIRNPFTTGWLGVPTLSFYFNSLTIEFLGMTKTGLRLPWALVGAATVLAAFFLVRRLHTWTLALATSLLLATYHYHIHFSRLGSNQIADPLFVTLSLALLYLAIDRRRTIAWILAGVVTGLALYFYAGARFTPVVIAAILALNFLHQKGDFLRAHVHGILAMVGGFLVVAAPMIQYAMRFPHDFNARLNQVGIIQSGWLERELAAGAELVPTLWEQFRRALLAFNYYPDRTVWYGLDQPLLEPLAGAIFVVGLLYATLLVIARRDLRVMPFVIWWWGGILTGGVLTESPPSSQRLTTLAVPTCFLIAFTLWRIVGLARAAIPRLPRRPLFALSLLALAVISLHLYFVEFTPQHRYGGRHAELATTLAPLLNDLDQTHDAYFVGAPWMYWGFATIPYLSPAMNGQDLEDPLTAPPSPRILRPGRGGVFIVRPERADELPLIQQTFPRGRRLEVHSRAPGEELLATLYIVPPPATP